MRTLTFGFLNLNTLPAGNASPFETVTAAAAGGFNSVGLRVAGRRPQEAYGELVGNPSRTAALRQHAHDSGTRISSVTAYGFFPDVGMDHHERVIETAASLGCTLMILNVYYEDFGAFTEALATLSDRAARHGVSVGIEFMPFSGLRTLQDAERAIDVVAHRNVGHVIDALHLSRSGGTPKDVRAVDPSRIFLGQLCDAKRRDVRPTDDELRVEARLSRSYPGEGDVPLHDFISALPAKMEIEIEVPRSDFGAMDFTERARTIGTLFRGFMTEYETRAARG